MIRQFMAKRQELAFKRLKENICYSEICERQDKSEAIVDELLRKLEKDESITIRSHYEGENDKIDIMLNEVYLQGLRDSVKILALLGVFGVDTSL